MDKKIIILMIVVSLLLFGCSTTDDEVYEKMRNKDNPIVVMETNLGTIEIEMYEDIMPVTAGNFLELTRKGFYDGVIFHRVILDFMIQGGDPEGSGMGGPGYTIKDEFSDELSNVVGTISMANAGPNTGGSQFFINTADNVFLDHNKPPMNSKHPVFGQVLSGMDVVDAISSVKTNAMDKPRDEIVMTRVYVKGE